MSALAAPAQDLSAPAPPPRELVVMAEDATLTSWSVLERLTAEFEERHPGARVRLLSLGGAAGTQDKLKFMLAGGLQLDVTRIDVTEAAAYLSEDALIDLEPLAARTTDFDPEAFFAAPLAALRDDRGHLFGLPQTFTPYVMYVNRSLLAAEGLTAPGPEWTWDELLDHCRAATRDLDGDGRSDQYGISLTQWLQAVSPWIWQAGGSLLEPSGERSGMDSPGSRRALTFLHGLLHVERVASFDATFAGQLQQGLFQAGRALYYGPVGYWETYRFQHIEDFEWDVLPLPRDRTAATAVAMGIYVVPRTSRHPDLAFDFLHEVLCAEPYQRVMAEIGNGVPGLRAAAYSTSFLRPDQPPASAQVFLDVMDVARFMPPLANWRKIESLCQAELEGTLLTGAVAPEDAAMGMAAKTDAFLERERARRGRPRLGGWVLELFVAGSLLGALGWFLARRGRRPGRAHAREERHGYALISLWAVGFLAFLLGPACVSLLLSFCDWSPLRSLDEIAWAGTANYARLPSDPTFASSLRATALYALLSVPCQLLLALVLALLLRSESWLSSVARTVCYLPAVLSPVIVAVVWQAALEPDSGPINAALRSLGWTEPPAWLRDPAGVIPAFALMALWSVGAQLLVYLAALQALDPSLEEAARLDGAGAWRRVRYVVLPQLGPVTLFNLITGTIAAFQVFAQPYIMTQGGPGDASRFLVLYLYESGFRHLDMGYASALAWVLFGILAVLTTLLLVGSRPLVHYAGRSSS